VQAIYIMGLLKWLIDNYVIDTWTIIHLLFWALLVFIFPKKTPFWQVLFLCTVIAFAWEVTEMHMEDILQRRYREPFLNRWVSDPIVDVTGSLMALFRRQSLLRKDE
jgi:hypothetical protein